MVTPKRRPIPLTPRTLPSAEQGGGGRKKSAHFLWLWLSSFCNLYLRILCPLCVAVIYSSTISLLCLLLLLLPPAVAAAAASIPHRDSLTFLIIHPSFSRSPKLTEPPKAIRSDCLISRHQVGRAEMKNEDSSQPLFLFCFHSPFHSSLSLSLYVPSRVFFLSPPFPPLLHASIPSGLTSALCWLFHSCFLTPSSTPGCQSHLVPPLVSVHSAPLPGLTGSSAGVGDHTARARTAQ